MPIYIGNQKINISGVSKVYVGSQLVYQPGVVELDYIMLSNPTTSLSRGATFSFGGTVTAYYTDGTSADVTADTTFSGYNMATAGTYTVTASYTEGEITKTATYTLTVNKAWTTVWSGSKSKTVSNATGNEVEVWTNNVSGTATFRFTFTMSASGGSGTTYYYNGSNTQTTTKPSSPKQMNIAYGTSSSYIVGVARKTSDNGKISGVKLQYTAGSLHKFSLVGITGQYGYNGTATMTVTKIERYY